VEITQDVIDQPEDEDDADVGVPALKLPTCELSHLDEIASFFVSCLASPIKRERLSVAIESDGYIRKLTDVFHSCEDNLNVDALHRLYSVFKSIFLLNKTALFEIMFADDLIFSVLGAMEYDPVLDKPADHRHYLSSETCLKQVTHTCQPLRFCAVIFMYAFKLKLTFKKLTVLNTLVAYHMFTCKFCISYITMSAGHDVSQTGAYVPTITLRFSDVINAKITQLHLTMHRTIGLMVPCEGFHVNAPVCCSHSWVQ